jgi:hypothetical protein
VYSGRCGGVLRLARIRWRHNSAHGRRCGVWNRCGHAVSLWGSRYVRSPFSAAPALIASQRFRLSSTRHAQSCTLFPPAWSGQEQWDVHTASIVICLSCCCWLHSVDRSFGCARSHKYGLVICADWIPTTTTVSSITNTVTVVLLSRYIRMDSDRIYDLYGFVLGVLDIASERACTLH